MSYEDLSKQLDTIKEKYNEKDIKKYRLNLLERIIKRLTVFSSECVECEKFKEKIAGLVKESENIAAASGKKRKDYFKDINLIVGHLQKKHSLVAEGYYIAIFLSVGMSIGVAFGLLLGTSLDNPGAGLPIGIGAGLSIGIGIGAARDKKAKDDGKVI